MPSHGANPGSRRWRKSALRRALRVVGVLLALGIGTFCALLLAIRFVVFPQIEDYRSDVAAALGRTLGSPVEISTISAGWDGWNPKLLIGGVRVASVVNRDAAPLLEVPEAGLVISWLSLPLFDLRFKLVEIERPRLAIRRDRAGMLHAAGMEFDPASASKETPVVDWILRQPHIAIRDAVIVWDDDLRNAPQLVLNHVYLRLDSRFNRHRFGLRGTPPAELAAPFDVRGDLRNLAGGWSGVSGKVYARLEYADLAAWADWIPLPVPVDSGKGALRVWLDISDGIPNQAVADLELADVLTTLRDDLPPLRLDRMSGRVGWKDMRPQREFYVRSLAFVEAKGVVLDPTDVTVTLRESGPGVVATGLVEFDRLQLAPLRELAARLPLPERMRKDLALFAPRGTLRQGRMLWEGPPDDVVAYTAAAEFSDVGIAAHDGGPGISGATGRLELTQGGGKLKLASRNAALDLPQVFTASITFDSLDGDASWVRAGGTTTLTIDQLEFANRDAAGRVSGRYRTTPSGPGEIDLKAEVTRADVSKIHQYMPRVIDEEIRDWLRQGLVRGSASDGRMELVGNLASFPFRDRKSGRFVISAKGRDVVMNYHRDWPLVTDLDGDFAIDGARLSVVATRGRVLGVTAAKARAEIADYTAARPLLAIDIDVTAATASFLRFVDASPVADWLDHLTDGAKASGNSRLGLKLQFPLGNAAGNRVAGEFDFLNDDVDLVGVPQISQLSGRLDFTEASVRAPELEADIGGGKARFSVASGDGKVQVNGGGTASVAALGREFDVPLADTLSGSFDWKIAVGLQGRVASWTLDSDLAGAAIDLPAPMGKTAGERVPLKVERHATIERGGEDSLTVTYGNVGRLQLERKLEAAGASIERALLLLGPAAAVPRVDRLPLSGFWVRGQLPELSIDDWLAVERLHRNQAGAALGLSGLDLDLGVLEAFGRRLQDIHVAARRTRDDWRLDINGRQLAGTASWAAPSPGAPNGRVTARLARLEPPEAAAMSPWAGTATAPKPEAAASNPWPAIDLIADSYRVRNHDLGRLEFVAQPLQSEWRIDRLALSSGAGSLLASGQWRSRGDEQTILDVDLDVKDAGKFLAQFGQPDAVREAPTQINGHLAWAGAPNEFDYPTLSGMFKIQVGPGRFTKVDPGIGKLLSVLSLQMLPRRITLDFNDIFSEGFTFDDITGDVSVSKGVLHTTDLKLTGSAAKVAISGSVDLATETQQLGVRVQPALSASVSTGAMLLMMANPAVGAAIGAGALLAQKVLSDPIEQMFSYEYLVTGSWADPIVVKRNTLPAAPAPSTTAR